MLRISEKDRTQEGLTLKLEGRVIGLWVAELRRACEQAISRGLSLHLDVTDVTFIARQALPLFDELISGSVRLDNCPAFLSEQLKYFTRDGARAGAKLSTSAKEKQE